MATRKLAVGWRVARTVESKSLDVGENSLPLSLFFARALSSYQSRFCSPPSLCKRVCVKWFLIQTSVLLIHSVLIYKYTP